MPRERATRSHPMGADFVLECGTIQVFVRSTSTPLVAGEQVALRIVSRQAILATAAG